MKETIGTCLRLGLLLFSGFVLATPLVAQPQTLTVNIGNIKKIEGDLVIGIYKTKEAWPEKPLLTIEFPVTANSQATTVELDPGNYAISVYQDVDGDGKLDSNFMGIPKEPIGFANNYKPFGKPKFDKAMISLDGMDKTIQIELYKIF